MTGIHLLDRDNRDKPTRALGRAVDRLDAGNVHLFQFLPQGRAIAQRHRHVCIGDRAPDRRQPKDRIVAIGHAVHLDEWTRGRADAGIITGVFAKGPFGQHRHRVYFTFDDDFRGGGNRQVYRFASHHVERETANRTGVIQFGFGCRDAGRAEHEHQRVAANHRGNRHRLLQLGVLFEHHIGVFAFDELRPQCFLVEHLEPVGAYVDPAAFRRLCNTVRGRPEKAPAIFGIDLGYRELE